MRRNLPLLVLVGIVVILGGYLIFNNKETPETNRNLPAQRPAQNQSRPPGQTQPSNQTQPSPDIQAKKSVVPDTDPRQGEYFIQGEVKAVDVEKRIITIEQHMDDNSKTVNPNIPVKKEAIVQNKKEDVGLAQIKAGDIVGLVLTKEGFARAVLVD